MGEDLLFNSFIRFIYASYIELVFAVALNYQEQQYVSWGCWYSNMHFWLFTPVVIVTPAVFALLLYCLYDSLHYKHVAKWIGTAYDDLVMIENRSAAFKPGLFLLHRQLIAGALVLLPGNPVLKTWCFIISIEVYTTYVVVAKPYADRQQQKDETFNLYCVIIIVTHLLWFTDFVPNADDRYSLGYSCVAFLLFNVLWNLTFIMIHAVQGIVK